MKARSGLPSPESDGYAFFTGSHAARCTARHGVGSHAEPPTIECAPPVTQNVAPRRAPDAVAMTAKGLTRKS